MDLPSLGEKHICIETAPGRAVSNALQRLFDKEIWPQIEESKNSDETGRLQQKKEFNEKG